MPTMIFWMDGKHNTFTKLISKRRKVKLSFWKKTDILHTINPTARVEPADLFHADFRDCNDGYTATPERAFFLLFSAIFASSCFDEKMMNTQIPNAIFRLISWFGIWDDMNNLHHTVWKTWRKRAERENCIVPQFSGSEDRFPATDGPPEDNAASAGKYAAPFPHISWSSGGNTVRWPISYGHFFLKS